MKLEQMKEKILSLIEELNPASPLLTDDPDIAAKIDPVINQVMTELSRLKKLPRLLSLEVQAGQELSFEDLQAECGREVYQLSNVTGADYVLRAGGRVIRFLSPGRVTVDLFVYPQPVAAGQELELSRDVLEILPYGVAADLLKTDISAGNGQIYAQRYKEMLNLLDPRYSLSCITFEGGLL